MAHHPNHDTHLVSGKPPLSGEVERERTDIRVVSLLGGIALLVAVGMWFYTKDREMVASDGTTVKQTTGSSIPDAQQHDRPSQRAPGTPQ